MNNEKANGGGKKVFLAIPRQQGEDKGRYSESVIFIANRYSSEHPSVEVLYPISDMRVNILNVTESEEVVFFKGWEEDTHCVTYNRLARDMQLVMTYEQPISELMKGK